MNHMIRGVKIQKKEENKQVSGQTIPTQFERWLWQTGNDVIGSFVGDWNKKECLSNEIYQKKKYKRKSI